MAIFDLIFLLAMFATVVTLICVAVALIRGRRASALRFLRNCGICLAVYLTVSIGVAAVKPHRVMQVGEAWCFDDWCLTVQNVSRAAAGAQVSSKIDLLMSSRARRVTQRAKGAWLYLIDEHGHRYAPERDPSALPLDCTAPAGGNSGDQSRFPRSGKCAPSRSHNRTRWAVLRTDGFSCHWWWGLFVRKACNDQSPMRSE
jgi:hypothetical protein